MVDATLTIKNYRCFQDSHPLTIKIRPGFTALVGQNNSGKSSILKMFYELRNVFFHFASAGNLAALNGGSRWGIGHQGLFDPQEIFTDTNARPLEIQIEVPSEEGPNPTVTLVRLRCDRAQPNVWGGVCHYGKERRLLPSPVNGVSDTIILTEDSHLQVDCTSFLTVMKNLAGSLYVGPFRNAINQGSGAHFDLAVGTAFSSMWNSWKLGPTKAQNLAIENITNDIRKIFEYDKLEITASEVLHTLQVNTNNKPYKLEELGAGLAQFIIVFGNVGIKKPTYILIDEPELNLHPSLQVDFLTSLASYASEGTIYATHSIGLARTIGDQIYSLRKIDDESRVRQFESTPNYAEFLGEMSFSMYQELGHERLLLVEGVKDVRTVQQLLRKIGKDHMIVILPLGGDQLARSGVEVELSEIKRLSRKIAVLVDSERQSCGAPPVRRREEFRALCEKLGFDVCLTERRALENYLVDRAVKAVHGEKYRGLGEYEGFDELPLPWSKSDDWRIAREMLWDEMKDTDVGRFLESM